MAAGKSTRMKSDYSKVVHKILGKEIINFLLDNLVEAGIEENDIILVAGQNLEELKQVISRDVRYVIQQRQLGTADALMAAKEYMDGFDGDVLVVVGDNPYISSGELKRLIRQHRQNKANCSMLSAVFPSTPPAYGRIIRDENGAVSGIVEQLDATPEQLKIREVNASIYLFDNPVVFPLLFKIDNNNAKGEYYLTDIIHILKERGHTIDAVKTDDYFVSIGINNRWELQEAQQRFNEARLKQLAVEQGVTVLQPDTVTVEFDVEIGTDTVIYPNTYIAAGTRIGKNCEIGPFVYLKNVEVADNETIQFGKRVE